MKNYDFIYFNYFRNYELDYEIEQKLLMNEEDKIILDTQSTLTMKFLLQTKKC